MFIYKSPRIYSFFCRMPGIRSILLDICRIPGKMTGCRIARTYIPKILQETRRRDRPVVPYLHDRQVPFLLWLAEVKVLIYGPI